MIPQSFKAFHVDETRLYIHPNIWREAVVPLALGATLYDKQGNVHVRVSCNFAEEFGIFLSIEAARARISTDERFPHSFCERMYS